MTYAVVYLKDKRITGMPFRCPTYSRQLFEKKRSLKIPCALMWHGGENQKAKMLDSFEVEILEKYINA